MERRIAVRVDALSIEDENTAWNVYQLQQAAYRAEAELIGFAALPPLQETMDQLQGSTETFFGCFLKEELAGIISVRVADGCCDIHRLAVQPHFFRRGIAGQLLTAVFAAYGDIKYIVTAAERNIPALICYYKHGFRETGRREVVPGLRMVALRRDKREGLGGVYR